MAFVHLSWHTASSLRAYGNKRGDTTHATILTRSSSCFVPLILSFVFDPVLPPFVAANTLHTLGYFVTCVSRASARASACRAPRVCTANSTSSGTSTATSTESRTATVHVAHDPITTTPLDDTAALTCLLACVLVAGQLPDFVAEDAVERNQPTLPLQHHRHPQVETHLWSAMPLQLRVAIL